MNTTHKNIAYITKINYPTKKNKRTVISIEVKCPFCSKTHTHGGGTVKEDVNKYFGSRISHCIKGECKGYYLCLKNE